MTYTYLMTERRDKIISKRTISYFYDKQSFDIIYLLLRNRFYVFALY